MLSSSVSVTHYLELERSKDKAAIANFLKERLLERYVDPFKGNPKKNGFSMMAVIVSDDQSDGVVFRGWPKSPSSQLAFCDFLDRNPQFSDLHGLHGEFYRHVRCGILHQGETTGGWHIRRDLRHLFHASTRTIDATRFQEALEQCLASYCTSLVAADWDAVLWRNLRRKMKSICANVEAT